MDPSTVIWRCNQSSRRSRKSCISSGPLIKETQRVVKRTLGLYQHGQQPKAGSSSYQWSPTVENPWDKEFSPKDFSTAHKIPSTLPKRWELHEDSPLMLKPPTSTAVDQVPDAWLEAFAARSAHSATISSTSLEAVYNFLQKVIIFLHSFVAKDSIKNDASLIHGLLQRANSVLEAQLMSHDAGVTTTELYTHLHMLHRRTVLESSTVDLLQCNKDRLLVMAVGCNNLFGSNACKVQEWKKDTEEEGEAHLPSLRRMRKSR